MDIDRNTRSNKTMEEIKFSLDHLENDGFTKGIDWNTRITKRLTLEELIGALVHAESLLNFHRIE